MFFLAIVFALNLKVGVIFLILIIWLLYTVLITLINIFPVLMVYSFLLSLDNLQKKKR